ncbi:MAG: monooxygenase [Caulobacteraceae bacterium]|nr:monooxygenase [Caulobacteraceae bacterium]
MTGAAFDCDVLIVGLGPVGATLAALLATHGLETIAIDRDAAVYPLPRAVHFDDEIMRLLQQLGVADEVGRNAVPVPRYEFRSSDGEILASFDPVAEAHCGWESGYMFHQPSLELALRDRLATLPQADMRLGWRFDQLSQDASGATANVDTPNGARTIRARYLVGCDGARSPVREAIGGGLFDYAFDEPWLVIDARVQPGARLPEANVQLCDPDRPVTCVHSGPGRRRWEFMLLPGETTEKAVEDDFIRTLLAPFDCGPVEIERRAVYRFHGLVANRWREGRVLLAGDSAHQTPPFAGQGMCSGLRDAANLAWKLAAVLDGRADEALLDTYQAEREPHARTLIELAIAMGRVVCNRDREAAAARDRDMLARRASGAPPPMPPLRPAPLRAGCVMTGAGGAGEIFPQPTAGSGTRRLRLDDALGEGAWLISREPITVCDPNLAAHQLGEDLLAPFRAAIAGWLDKHRAKAVLVRPDRYVFGAGEPDALASAWAQALRPRREAA